MQDKYIKINSLKVSESLSKFVAEELLKDTEISTDKFWLGFEKTVNELEPKNRDLINFREILQKKIDDWHIKNKRNEFNLDQYKKFLFEIDYLKEEVVNKLEGTQVRSMWSLYVKNKVKYGCKMGVKAGREISYGISC